MVVVVCSGQLAFMLPFEVKCRIFPAINAGYFAVSQFPLCGVLYEFSVGLIPVDSVRNEHHILDRPGGILRRRLNGAM